MYANNILKMVKVTNKLVLREEKEVTLVLGVFTISITVVFKRSSCKIALVYRSKDTGARLSALKLRMDVKDDEFQTPYIIKQSGSRYSMSHNAQKDLNLVLNTLIYGWLNTLSVTTDKDECTYTIEASATLSSEGQSGETTGNHFVSYIDFLDSWWPPEAIAAAIGVPPYSHSYAYNTLNLAFWTTNQGPVDVALLWSNAIVYCSADNPWGNTTQAIQQAWINAYHAYGVKALVSAFGATDFPMTQGADPIVTAEALAKFVIDNNLDGVDLDYEDNAAMETGTGVPWLISCTTRLRELLPAPYIITHAPQAPYFMGTSKYPDGGYLTINSQVGSMIDWYNIQFYNQDSSKYDTYQTLFNVSDGWATNSAVKQIATSVPKEKLVVGKGVTPADYYNTGYVQVDDLAAYLKQGVNEGYSAGFMGWQFSSDTTGSWSETLANSF
eukprot:Pompholyxophrys_sp_v1_NODE_1_length_32789_cov_6.460653.p7 type:complete len:441 gc:universal NODE_1_length_32789_cov_6.460653:7430-6108(-)